MELVEPYGVYEYMVAKHGCRICRQQIGFENPYHVDPEFSDSYVHSKCLGEEVGLMLSLMEKVDLYRRAA